VSLRTEHDIGLVGVFFFFFFQYGGKFFWNFFFFFLFSHYHADWLSSTPEAASSPSVRVGNVGEPGRNIWVITVMDELAWEVVEIEGLCTHKERPEYSPSSR
jgi:hypothetical protein